ncbi:MAG: aminopeptidase [Gaiellales bacterium]
MRDYGDLTRRLADLIVGCGANVQPGQIVHVSTYLGNEDLTREVTRAAYQRGASWVDVLSTDLYVKRERLLHAAEDTLDFVPPWLIDRLDWLADERGARISLAGLSQPEALDGVDPTRAGRDMLPYVPNLGTVINRNTTLWCVAPCPTPAWARVVYPELPEEEAFDRLWDAIAHMCRLDEPDPTTAWKERSDALKAVAARLTERRFDAIRLHGPGTDVTVGLLPSSAWNAGAHTRDDGLSYMANIPTEEIFTSPDPLRVDGHVTSTRPLEVYGAKIDGIRVEFAGGRAVRIDADTGAEMLRGYAATDDGASRLGELALVDGEGRVGPLETTFHVTLLDENSASHIALGSAYETGIETDEDKARLNKSKIHIDFMIGSPELDVDGLTKTGETVPLLRNGSWQI